jgi:hypothetical protein
LQHNTAVDPHHPDIVARKKAERELKKLEAKQTNKPFNVQGNNSDVPTHDPVTGRKLTQKEREALRKQQALDKLNGAKDGEQGAGKDGQNGANSEQQSKIARLLLMIRSREKSSPRKSERH